MIETRGLRRWLLALLCMLMLAPALRAAVPHQDAVPAYAEEQTILQQEKDVPEPGWWSLESGRRHFDRNFLIPWGRDAEPELILQRGGNTWRTLRNGPISTISAVILLLVPLAIFVLWRKVGPARVEEPETGRRIERFTRWQRWVHWATAISFSILAISGLLIFFGKKLLIPLLGHAAFSWLAVISKYLHNIVGPVFIVCSIVMFFTFLRENRFNRRDWQWVKRGGGIVTHEHVPAGYFNAGEKAWFWLGVVLLGLVMSVTGLILDFPTQGPTRYLLQLSNYLHIAAGTFYIAAALGHIYLGTLGTPGAYEAMRHGTVDETWARAHHRDWYEQVQARQGDAR
ncbi:MAG TPA: formate dehydrogenase subunit gamma [Ramlibacter sp.]|jgi:formate dehydrogenase subunit gamma